MKADAPAIKVHVFLELEEMPGVAYIKHRLPIIATRMSVQ